MERRDADEEGSQRQGQGKGIALKDEVGDGVVEAEGLAEVGMEDAVPVMGVLLAEGGVEAVGVTEGGDVGSGGSFAEHLDDRVARDEMDEEKDQGDDDPEDGEGEEDAAEGLGQLDHLLSSPATAVERAKRIGGTWLGESRRPKIRTWGTRSCGRRVIALFPCWLTEMIAWQCLQRSRG